MGISELRQKQVSELKETLVELLKKQFKMRMQKSQGGLVKTHQLKQVRKDIARVTMLIADNKKAGKVSNNE